MTNSREGGGSDSRSPSASEILLRLSLAPREVLLERCALLHLCLQSPRSYGRVWRDLQTGESPREGSGEEDENAVAGAALSQLATLDFLPIFVDASRADAFAYAAWRRAAASDYKAPSLCAGAAVSPWSGDEVVCFCLRVSLMHKPSLRGGDAQTRQQEGHLRRLVESLVREQAIARGESGSVEFPFAPLIQTAPCEGAGNPREKPAGAASQGLSGEAVARGLFDGRNFGEAATSALTRRDQSAPLQEEESAVASETAAFLASEGRVSCLSALDPATTAALSAFEKGALFLDEESSSPEAAEDFLRLVGSVGYSLALRVTAALRDSALLTGAADRQLGASDICAATQTERETTGTGSREGPSEEVSPSARLLEEASQSLLKGLFRDDPPSAIWVGGVAEGEDEEGTQGVALMRAPETGRAVAVRASLKTLLPSKLLKDAFSSAKRSDERAKERDGCSSGASAFTAVRIVRVFPIAFHVAVGERTGRAFRRTVAFASAWLRGKARRIEVLQRLLHSQGEEDQLPNGCVLAQPLLEEQEGDKAVEEKNLNERNAFSFADASEASRGKVRNKPSPLRLAQSPWSEASCEELWNSLAIAKEDVREASSPRARLLMHEAVQPCVMDEVSTQRAFAAVLSRLGPFLALRREVVMALLFAPPSRQQQRLFFAAVETNAADAAKHAVADEQLSRQGREAQTTFPNDDEKGRAVPVVESVDADLSLQRLALLNSEVEMEMTNASSEGEGLRVNGDLPNAEGEDRQEEEEKIKEEEEKTKFAAPASGWRNEEAHEDLLIAYLSRLRGLSSQTPRLSSASFLKRGVAVNATLSPEASGAQGEGEGLREPSAGSACSVEEAAFKKPSCFCSEAGETNSLGEDARPCAFPAFKLEDCDRRRQSSLELGGVCCEYFGVGESLGKSFREALIFTLLFPNQRILLLQRLRTRRSLLQEQRQTATTPGGGEEDFCILQNELKIPEAQRAEAAVSEATSEGTTQKINSAIAAATNGLTTEALRTVGLNPELPKPFSCRKEGRGGGPWRGSSCCFESSEDCAPGLHEKAEDGGGIMRAEDGGGIMRAEDGGGDARGDRMESFSEQARECLAALLGEAERRQGVGVGPQNGNKSTFREGGCCQSVAASASAQAGTAELLQSFQASATAFRVELGKGSDAETKTPPTRGERSSHVVRRSLQARRQKKLSFENKGHAERRFASAEISAPAAETGEEEVSSSSPNRPSFAAAQFCRSPTRTPVGPLPTPLDFSDRRRQEPHTGEAASPAAEVAETQNELFQKAFAESPPPALQGRRPFLRGSDGEALVVSSASEKAELPSSRLRPEGSPSDGRAGGAFCATEDDEDDVDVDVDHEGVLNSGSLKSPGTAAAQSSGERESEALSLKAKAGAVGEGQLGSEGQKAFPTFFFPRSAAAAEMALAAQSTGVYFDVSRAMWRCQWKERGRLRSKGFPIQKFGDSDEAWRACVSYRAAKIARLTAAGESPRVAREASPPSYTTQKPALEDKAQGGGVVGFGFAKEFDAVVATREEIEGPDGGLVSLAVEQGRPKTTPPPLTEAPKAAAGAISSSPAESQTDGGEGEDRRETRQHSPCHSSSPLSREKGPAPFRAPLPLNNNKNNNPTTTNNNNARSFVASEHQRPCEDLLVVRSVKQLLLQKHKGTLAAPGAGPSGSLSLDVGLSKMLEALTPPETRGRGSGRVAETKALGKTKTPPPGSASTSSLLQNFSTKDIPAAPLAAAATRGLSYQNQQQDQDEGEEEEEESPAADTAVARDGAGASQADGRSCIFPVEEKEKDFGAARFEAGGVPPTSLTQRKSAVEGEAAKAFHRESALPFSSAAAGKRERAPLSATGVEFRVFKKAKNTQPSPSGTERCLGEVQRRLAVLRSHLARLQSQKQRQQHIHALPLTAAAEQAPRDQSL